MQINHPDKTLARAKHVYIAVSGGLDSMVLLRWVHEYCKSSAYTNSPPAITVLHVNHGLRGQESDDDAAFVAQQCSLLQIPCLVHVLDKRFITARRGMEDSARTARYEWFYSQVVPPEYALPNLQAKEHNPHLLLTAHTANDRLESLLMALQRGTGLRGLRTIATLRNHWVYRPLLQNTRSEIEAFAQQYGVLWRTDSSNTNLCYTRNQARHVWIPALTPHHKDVHTFCKQAERIAVLAQHNYQIAQEHAQIFTQCRVTLPFWSKSCMAWSISKLVQYQAGDELFRIYLQQTFNALQFGSLEQRHLDTFVHCLEHKPSQTDWGNGWSIYVSEDILCVVPPPNSVLARSLKIVDNPLDHSTNTDFTILVKPELVNNKDLQIRERNPGDLFEMPGKGIKKLKSLLYSVNLPVVEKQHVPVIESKGEIIWCAALGVACSYAVLNAKQQSDNASGLLPNTMEITIRCQNRIQK
jgi:tRNA(Ile)-lysidine synthase